MVQGQFVSVTSGGESPRGYLARPDGGGTYPGVILIMEAGGVNEHIQNTITRLADEGFVVLGPDLYRGKTGTDMESTMALMRGLDQEQALGDIDACIEYLKGQNVTSDRFGVVGFCMGGRYTWWTAMRHDDLACIAPFYAGRFHPEAGELATVTAPALIMWGSKDQSTPPEDREHILNTLTQGGKFFKAVTYPAGHAFMTPEAQGYDETTAEDAWPTLLNWFKTYLR
jgi:carboxymethylenebutenolidase